ncbi:hypothetical protein OQA88_3134 [Cercophora sp. LCS_1]
MADSKDKPTDFDVVKEYPQRGHLQQFRLAKVTTFMCDRCSKQKTAKLVAVKHGDWNVLVCNGCYGWLLANNRGTEAKGAVQGDTGRPRGKEGVQKRKGRSGEKQGLAQGNNKVEQTTIKMRLLLAILLLATTTLAAPSPGCGKTPTLKANNTITTNGKQRYFILNLPANYNNTHPYRLIFTFHALGGSGTQLSQGGAGAAYWGIPPAANNTAIFISPNGQTAGSVGNLMGWGNRNNEDVVFVDDILSSLSSDLCFDTNLVFSTGFSYGGAISYAIACARPKVFRAVAVMSSNPISGCEGGTEPIAYYHQQGTKDQALPFRGALPMRDRYVKLNGCKAVVPEPEPPAGGRVKVVYEGCDARYPVTWIAFDGDHTPTPRDAGGVGSFTTGEIWGFFGQFK